MISLDSLDSALHSVEIKDASGQALALDASGFLTANINGSVVVTASALDIRALTNADVVTIEDGGGSITVDGTVAATQSGTWNVNTTPGGYGSWKVTAVSATNTESELVAVPLTGRLAVEIQNLGNQDVFLKEITGVSISNGMKIPKGSSYSANLDDISNLFAITASGTADLRIVEYAA